MARAERCSGVAPVTLSLRMFIPVDEELARILAPEYKEYEELVAHLYEAKPNQAEVSEQLEDN
jgi:hypothetical protein